MVSLLQQTLEMLQDYDLTEDDVIWVGSEDFSISWEDFKLFADVEYYSGYGSPEVATDLVIVGEGWWLERSEYDGSEWWSMKQAPKQPLQQRVGKINLTVGQFNTQYDENEYGYMTLLELNTSSPKFSEEDYL